MNSTATPKTGNDFGQGYIQALMEQTADGVFLEDHVLAPQLSKYLGPLRGKRGIDLGCGYGMNTRRLLGLSDAETGEGQLEIVGIDISQEMLTAAEQQTGIDARVQYEMMGADKLKFVDNSFDFAASAFVLENMPDQVVRDGFVEAHRVIKSGGCLVVVMVHPTWFLMVSGDKQVTAQQRYGRYNELHVVVTDRTPEHTYTRNYRSLEWYLNKAVDAGLKLTRIRALEIPNLPDLPEKYHSKIGFPVFSLMVFEK